MDKNIIHQYIDGTISEADLATVINWLDESPEHVKEFMALQKLYQISVLNPTSYAKTSASTAKPKNRINPFVYEVLKIAAVFLLFWGGSSLYNSWKGNTEPTVYQSLYVPAGQRAQLTLPDGTKVWVNAKSSIKYPLSFGKKNRRVELDGEAYFEVEKDKKRPFSVKTRTVEVNVLGTTFNLKAYAEKPWAEVALLEGKVNLTSPEKNRRIEMKPNEVVRYQEGNFSKSSIKNFDYFRWREGLICFDNESVGEILKKMELYYDIKIDIKKKSLLDQYYSGKFRTKDGVEQVLKLLQIELHFEYTIDKDNNLLTIK